MFLVPDRVLESYQAVTVPLLRENGIRFIISDLDYTLAPKSVPEPDEALLQWLQTLRENGVTLLILSNNRNPRRVTRFCSAQQIPFIGHARKPLRRGFLAAMERYRARPEETVVLGDKLLTDCLGAHCSGLKIWMVEPLGGAVTLWQKVLHTMQEPIKQSCRRAMG